MKLDSAAETALRTIPEHCRDGLRRYIEDRVVPGGFLLAVLENDLVGAFARADDINQYCMKAYAAFLYMHAPANCWGSRTKVVEWIKEKVDK